MTAAQIKRSVSVGDAYDVTNHYITKEDHPCYGTRRVTVTAVNGSSLHVEPGGRIEWPRASELRRYLDGTLRFYGGGIGQTPDDLFLTLTPA